MTCDDFLDLLVNAELVFKSGRSPEELTKLATLFAQDLGQEEKGAVARAFQLHQRRSRYFPRPVEIRELLAECRGGSHVQLPPAAHGHHTPGYGARAGRLILAWLRGRVSREQAEAALFSLPPRGRDVQAWPQPWQEVWPILESMPLDRMDMWRQATARRETVAEAAKPRPF